MYVARSAPVVGTTIVPSDTSAKIASYAVTTDILNVLVMGDNDTNIGKTAVFNAVKRMKHKW